MAMLVLLVLLAASTTWSNDVDTAPELTDGRVYMAGDLMIAALVSVHGDESGSWDLGCEEEVYLNSVENTQLLIEAVDSLNSNRSRLGGLRLGLELYDFCARDRNALAQAVRFLPQRAGAANPYVALLCCETSAVSVLVSQLTTAYQLPQVSTTATSDVLSDKTVHTYFLRTITPDRMQAQAILDLIDALGWTYIAVLYAEGAYGENLVRRVEDASKRRGATLCIGYSKKVSQTMEEVSFDAIVDDLLGDEFQHLSVVVLFIFSDQINALFSTLLQRNVTGRFVWIGSDGWWGNLLFTPESLRPVGVGGLSLMPGAKPAPQLYHFLSDPSKAFDSRNPWLNAYWETRFSCTVTSTCNVSALTTRQPPPLTMMGPYYHDSLLVVHEGLSLYLSTINFNLSLFSRKSFLAAMRSVRFDGVGGRVQFDESGDLLGSYVVKHGVPSGSSYDVVDVGSWSALDGRLDLDLSRILWPGRSRLVPESLCSKPCPAGHIQIGREQVCCWRCLRCRENEITNKNQSLCLQCPSLTWPNSDTAQSCVPIRPTFVAYSDPTGVALAIVAVVGAVVAVAAVGVLVRHSGHRLIKACCREASFVMLTAITLHFSLLFFLIGTPTYLTCILFRFGLHLTCSAIYAPIVIKISKIFRIFSEGKRSTRTPKFVSVRAQVAIIALLIGVEMIFVVITLFVDPPGATLSMPSTLQPVVESICNESATSLCIGLAFNLILIVGCAVFAFKTRKLPDNYNESSQVAFSVCTAIIVWLVFVPSLSATQVASRRVLMMALAIAINGFVVMIGLFFPKLYALYFVDESSVVFVDARSASAVNPVPSHSTLASATTHA